MTLCTKFYEYFFAFIIIKNDTKNRTINIEFLKNFKCRHLHEIKCKLIHSSGVAVFTVVSGNLIFLIFEKENCMRAFFVFIYLVIEKKTVALSTARFKM